MSPVRIFLYSVTLALLCSGCDASLMQEGEPGAREGATHPALAGSGWRVVSMGGEPVVPPGGRQRAPTVEFSSGDEAGGFGGCNRFSASYRLDGTELEFGLIAATKMACPGIGDLERRFFGALEATRSYRVREGVLDLLDGEGEVLARMEGQPERDAADG